MRTAYTFVLLLLLIVFAIIAEVIAPIAIILMALGTSPRTFLLGGVFVAAVVAYLTALNIVYRRRVG